MKVRSILEVVFIYFLFFELKVIIDFWCREYFEVRGVFKSLFGC